jgi:tripartite-type tricarboxylate transporter receptor subunit TctC
MKLPHRRQLLQLAAGAAALPAVLRIARAEAYPTRPVRLIVGFAPGGLADILARLFGQRLSDRLGQPFVVENRPGANGNIASEAVVRAPADGYTLLQFSASVAISPALYEKLNFNFVRDIAPVATEMRTPGVIVVNPTVPVKTLPEFIAYAKEHPGKLAMASAGNGSPQHVYGELFKMLAGVDLVHVPYRGGAPAITDLIAGQVQVVFSTVPESIEFIRAGKLRSLAVTTTTPVPVLPGIPTIAEYLPGYEASGWQGLGAPKKTPDEVIAKLNREINEAISDPTIKARLAEFGGIPVLGSPADCGKLIADETEKWAKVVKFSGAKPD